MRLVFVRHAESTGNAEGRYQGHAEYGLSETGVVQAERLRDRFVDEDLSPTHSYSSPMIRTSETARIAMEPWPLETRSWSMKPSKWNQRLGRISISGSSVDAGEPPLPRSPATI